MTSCRLAGQDDSEMMAIDGQPFMPPIAMLRSRGVYVQPPEMAQAISLPSWPKDLAMLAEQVTHAVGATASVSNMIAAVDQMLEQGIAAHMSHLCLDHFTNHPHGSASHDDDGFADKIAAVDDPAARKFIDDAIVIFAQLGQIVSRLPKYVSMDILRDAELEQATDPMGYLAACPVPVARLILTGQRGAVAACAAIHAVEHPGALAAWQMRETAKLWRDGLHATARLYASLMPDEVSEDLVPQAERLDLEALAKQRRQEDDFLAKLAQANPNESQFYIYDADA